LPGRSDLTIGISRCQAGPQPRPSPPGELLGGRQQQLADAVQRIALVAAVAQGGLLGPAADLVGVAPIADTPPSPQATSTLPMARVS
jgi:hypothetical protein